MVIEGPPEINPPSGRVPGQELLLIPISGSRWRQNSGENVEKESSLGIFRSRGINRAKVGHQRWGHLARQLGGAARPWPLQVAAWPGGAPWPPFGLLESSFIKDFLEFFWIFPAILFFHLFSAMHGQKQTKTAAGH